MGYKIGGGHKFQEYDDRNGRYCCNQNGTNCAYIESLNNLFAFSSLKDEIKTSKLMPNYKNAITLDEKFIKYSLDETHKTGRHKAIVYKKALGYTKENYITLKNQIHDAVTSGKAKLFKMSINDHNEVKYAFVISILGPNGNTAPVIVVYGIGENMTKPHLVTNYVKEE